MELTRKENGTPSKKSQILKLNFSNLTCIVSYEFYFIMYNYTYFTLITCFIGIVIAFSTTIK